jgi:hypothetical protein
VRNAAEKRHFIKLQCNRDKTLGFQHGFQVSSYSWFMMLRHKEKIISTALNKNMQAGNEN